MNGNFNFPSSLNNGVYKSMQTFPINTNTFGNQSITIPASFNNGVYTAMKTIRR